MPSRSPQVALKIGVISENRERRRRKEQGCDCFSSFCNIYFFTDRYRENKAKVQNIDSEHINIFEIIVFLVYSKYFVIYQVTM